MRYSKAYTIDTGRGPGAEKSDRVLRQIRAALIQRGTSLRQWVHDWAARTGRDPAATYETARSTIARNLERGSAPQGEIGRAFVEALRAELGPAVVPPSSLRPVRASRRRPVAGTVEDMP